MTRKNFFKALAGMIAGAFVVPEVVKAAREPNAQVMYSGEMPWRVGSIRPIKIGAGHSVSYGGFGQQYSQLDVVYIDKNGKAIIPEWPDDGLGGIPVRPVGPNPTLTGRA